MSESEFLRSFKERGFFSQSTDELAVDKLLKSNGQPVYIGFDCTAASLHVGSLIQIMILRLLQKCGHKPIILLGGGTTKVGDPSGKDETRKIQNDNDIIKNADGIKAVISKFIKFGDGETDAILVNNDQWLDELGYIAFLRKIGRHFSVNRMLSFESVKLRLDREQNLSFLEFNYMLLQAYDFVELFNKYNCRLQIGGSDQWGNIVNGIDLQKRLNPGGDESKNIYGLTTPLITTASGAKMGKTADGAVWLSDDLVTAYDYWQFWRNTEDKDVGRFLRLFTEIPIKEVQELEALTGADINKAKIILANEATILCHGKEKADEALQTAKKVFEQGGVGVSIPTIKIAKNELEQGIVAYKILVMANLAESGKAAKRLIEGGGAKINDEKISDIMKIINLQNINLDGHIKLSAGKKKLAILKIV